MRYEAVISRLKVDKNITRGTASDGAVAIETLLAEISELRKDAERYRLLRSSDRKLTYGQAFIATYKLGCLEWLKDSVADSAVEAMQQTKEVKG